MISLSLKMILKRLQRCKRSDWLNLVQLGSAWFSLVQLGSAWVSLGQLGSAWVSLGQLGSAWVKILFTVYCRWNLRIAFFVTTTNSEHITFLKFDEIAFWKTFYVAVRLWRSQWGTVRNEFEWVLYATEANTAFFLTSSLTDSLRRIYCKYCKYSWQHMNELWIQVASSKKYSFCYLCKPN